MRRTALAVAASALTISTAFTSAGSATATSTSEERCSLDGTLELRRTIEAGEPVRTGRCDGVRPGGDVVIETPDPDTNAGCTLNFVVTGSVEATDGTTSERRFIGTAGHCVLEQDGETVWERGAGPRASIRLGGIRTANVHVDYEEVEIGRFVYAVDEGARDLALIELHDGIEADPRMCHWGGPTGVDGGARGGSEFLRHSGHGAVWSWVTPGRTGYAERWDDPDVVYFKGVGAWGDSGSPVIVADTGDAAGVIKGIVAGGGIPGRTEVAIVATRFAPQMDRAADHLGLDEWRLETAPLEDEAIP